MGGSTNLFLFQVAFLAQFPRVGFLSPVLSVDISFMSEFLFLYIFRKVSEHVVSKLQDFETACWFNYNKKPAHLGRSFG